MILRQTTQPPFQKKFVCSLASSAILSPPVEESLVSAPQPCFEASEVMVISTSPWVIGVDADSTESIHHLSSSLAWLDRHFGIKVPFVVESSEAPRKTIL